MYEGSIWVVLGCVEYAPWYVADAGSGICECVSPIFRWGYVFIPEGDESVNTEDREGSVGRLPCAMDGLV